MWLLDLWVQQVIDRYVQILIGSCLLSFVVGFVTLPLLTFVFDVLSGKFNREG